MFTQDNFFCSELKKPQFNDAMEVSIAVKDESGVCIGELVAVGDWIFDKGDIIHSISEWRLKFNRMFRTQSPVNYDSTVDYLRKISRTDSNSILFLIYSDAGRLIGHIGLADLNKNPFEVINLMRGVGGGHPDLIYFAELSLIDFVFKNTLFSSSDVEVMSYNWMAISLHEKVGYRIKDSFPLKKKSGDFGVRHEIVEANTSNTNYSIIRLVLERSVFYTLAAFLDA